MIAALAAFAIAQSTDFRPLADPSTELAKTALANMQSAKDSVAKVELMKPFLSGYFYWRMQTLGSMPFGTSEKTGMSVASLVLNLYYPGTSDEWKKFAAEIEGKTITELPDDADQYLRIDLRQKVFQPYFDPASGKKPTAPQKQIDEFFVAIALADMSAGMTVYNTTKGHEYPQGMLSDGITDLAEQLAEFEGDPFTPEVRAKLIALTKIPKGQKLVPSDYPAFEKAFREAVMAIADLAKD